MRKGFFALVLAAESIFFTAAAQTMQEALDRFNARREIISKKGMLALGGMAAVQIAACTPLIFVTRNQWSYFHQMNVYWNVVNLGIATAGYLGTRKSSGRSHSLYETFEKQKASERIYLFNTGLDLAYMTTGALLNTLSYRVNKAQDLLKGFGNALLLQGGILLAFDVVMYRVYKNHGKKNLPALFERL
ncbi:MAG: hypothetical protein KatS3mg031_2521 [Chitinophagales bacterium]|nr:MAG: hypothetical protein KatS3mg031_2521 [Chitinophagales bacterium]